MYTLQITSADQYGGFSYILLNPAMAGTLSHEVERGDCCYVRDVREVLDAHPGKINLIADRHLTGEHRSELFAIACEYRIECPPLRG